MLRQGLPVGASLFPLGPRAFVLSVYIPTGNTCTPSKATSVLDSVPPTQGRESLPESGCSGSPRPAAGAALEASALPEVARASVSLSGSPPPRCRCGPRGRRRWRRRLCCCRRQRRRRSGTLERSWLCGMGERTRLAPLTDRQTDSVLAPLRLPRPCPCRPRRRRGRAGSAPWARPPTPALQTASRGLCPPSRARDGSSGRGRSPSRAVRPLSARDRGAPPAARAGWPGALPRESRPGCLWGHRGPVLPPTLSRKESEANPKCFAFRTASCWCSFATLMTTRLPFSLGAPGEDQS